MMDASTIALTRNPNSNFSNSRHRKPNKPHRDQNNRSNPMVVKFPAKDHVMGEVKILRRGESLAEFDKPQVCKENRKPRENQKPKARKMEKDVDLKLGSTDRIGPDPVTLQKQIKVDVKAESRFAAISPPPPSSVPVPVFLGRNCNGSVIATTNLRKLLRLD